jgi:8-oxo-dGTP pyrophosphatase MutT (NUDIX family)
MTLSATEALDIIERFEPGVDGLARKSRELAANLLRYSDAPFSRDQFAPGHLTCTALVFHPAEPKVLMMLHHRLRRWLLPGGHIEESDASLSEAAAREALEETLVQIDPNSAPGLVGIDVHGIPAKGDEPFHLHHDLIWSFGALSPEIELTDEAPSIVWAAREDWEQLQVADSIRYSILRALESPATRKHPFPEHKMTSTEALRRKA